MPRQPVRGAPFAGYITRLPAEWAKLNTCRGWGARESPPDVLSRPPKMQEGSVLCRAQPDPEGAGPSRYPDFQHLWHLRKVPRVAMVGCGGRATPAPA